MILSTALRKQTYRAAGSTPRDGIGWRRARPTISRSVPAGSRQGARSCAAASSGNAVARAALKQRSSISKSRNGGNRRVTDRDGSGISVASACAAHSAARSATGPASRRSMTARQTVSDNQRRWSAVTASHEAAPSAIPMSSRGSCTKDCRSDGNASLSASLARPCAQDSCSVGLRPRSVPKT